MLDQTLAVLLAICAAALVALAMRRWDADAPLPDSRPPDRLGTALRRVTRVQLRRPAMLPALGTVGAIAAAIAIRHGATPVKDVATLQGLSSAFAGGMLTIFTLLLGLTAGFTFTVIGTLGSTFTPLLSDPAIRAPRFWWFLAFATAGMFASAWLLLAPPVAPAELAVTLVCLFGSIVTLTVYLRGVALDANPATLLRRLTDNDVPPAGFKTFARGRPVQIGLAVVRSALQRRDGMIAAAVTYEVVRACAHFQDALVRKRVAELTDPALNWGVEYVAEVQSEFRQWVDELNDDPWAPAIAYDAAGRLLAFPLVWESTLRARLGRNGRTDGAEQAREDLEQPVDELLAAGGGGGGGDDVTADLRRMTMRTAAFGGMLNTIHSAQADLLGAADPPLAGRVARALAAAAIRLAARHGEALAAVPLADRYARRLVRSAQAPVAGQVVAIATLAGHAGLRELRAMVDGSAPARDTGAALFAAALRETLDRGVADPARTEDAARAAVADEAAAAS